VTKLQHDEVAVSSKAMQILKTVSIIGEGKKQQPELNNTAF
jgi:hypothetical protein